MVKKKATALIKHYTVPITKEILKWMKNMDTAS